MQLSIRVTGEGADILSFLLAKNPANLYDRQEKGHRVRLFYTVCAPTEAEAVLYVTPDPIELVTGSPDSYDITHHINDRQFAISSLFCSFARQALATALSGRCQEDYRGWVNHPFAMTLSFGPVASELSDEGIADLFYPLGYEIVCERKVVSSARTERDDPTARWLTLRGTATVQRALRQLFVLIPVMDDYRHHFLDEAELERLERFGEGWLSEHPLRGFVVRRSLRFGDLIRLARERFQWLDEVSWSEPGAPWEGERSFSDGDCMRSGPRIRLNDLRHEVIAQRVAELPERTVVVDMGAGEGKLSIRLGAIPGVRRILAVEPSEAAHRRMAKRLDEATLPSGDADIAPIWGSLLYADKRLAGADVMILCEVIEHIDEERVEDAVHTVLGLYAPRALIITTPNREWNALYRMRTDLRHDDHRFEWTRDEFRMHCERWAQRHGYAVTLEGVGEVSEQFGQPTQMAVFTRGGAPRG